MKFFTFILVAALLSVNFLQAQTVQLNTPLQRQLNTLLNGKTNNLQQLLNKYRHSNKTQSRSSQLSRLIAQSNYNYFGNGYQVIDSNQFAYTGSNGGDLNDLSNQTLKFTTENEYDYNNNAFNDDTLQRQTFDANGNIDSIIVQLWNSTTSQWQNFEGAHITYDANNNDTLAINYNWDNITNSWVILSEVENYYAGNFLDSEVIKEYDTQTSKFVNALQSYITIAGNDTTQTIEIWNSSDSSWLSSSYNYREISYYNDTSIIIQSYNTTDSTWSDYEKLTSSAIVNGIQFNYMYEYVSGTWDTTTKVISHYDSNLNDTTDLELTDDNDIWVNAAKYTYQYNSFNQMTYDAEYTASRIIDTAFIPQAEDFYYYQDYTAGINQLSARQLAGQLSIYPNPTSGIINITGSNIIGNLRVTNLLGQTVLIVTLADSGEKQTIDLSKFADGMYFVSATTGNETTVSKVLVSK